MSGLPLVGHEGGVILTVRVTPRARLTALAGLVEGADGRPALSIRLNAPPVDGAANRALIDFLASSLGIPPSSIRIHSGERSRLKRVAVAGLDPAQASEWLDRNGVTLAP